MFPKNVHCSRDILSAKVIGFGCHASGQKTKFIVNAAWNLLAIAKKMYLNLEKEGLAHGKPLLCINHKPFFGHNTSQNKGNAVQASKFSSWHPQNTLCWMHESWIRVKYICPMILLPFPGWGWGAPFCSEPTLSLQNGSGTESPSYKMVCL